MAKPDKLTLSKMSTLLLVEGDDEVEFFSSLNNSLGINNVQIFPVRGKENFKQNITNIPKLENFDYLKSIGIVRDADNSMANTFTSLQDALSVANLPVPPEPLVQVIKEQKVSVFLMPDNKSNGSLEDLCLRSVETEPIYECVNDYFVCLTSHEITYSHESKARIQVYLSHCSDVNARLGIAAKRGVWDWQNPVFNQLKSFLRQLSNND